MLAAEFPEIAQKLAKFRQQQTDAVLAHTDPRLP
jgi:phosphoribosylcarboxyaminoimidazole (NCAIR) mutase